VKHRRRRTRREYDPHYRGFGHHRGEPRVEIHRVSKFDRSRLRYYKAWLWELYADIETIRSDF
jgi:hypothetical protein